MHCLWEWEADVTPHNVVQKKNGKSLDGDGDNLKVGKTCHVRIREGSKMAAYSVKLLMICKCIAKQAVPRSGFIKGRLTVRIKKGHGHDADQFGSR